MTTQAGWDGGAILFPFALDAAGQRVAASEAPREGSYHCMACAQPMRVRRGAIRQAHFAHLERNPHCSPEKALHDLAKRELTAAWRAALVAGRPYRVRWTCACGEPMQGNLTRTTRTVREDFPVGRAQPDLVGLDAAGALSVAVELFVATDLTRTALTAYEAADVPVICVYPWWSDLEQMGDGLEEVRVELPRAVCPHEDRAAVEVLPLPEPPGKRARDPHMASPPEPGAGPSLAPQSDAGPHGPGVPGSTLTRGDARRGRGRAPDPPPPSARTPQAPPPPLAPPLCPDCGQRAQRALLELWEDPIPCWHSRCPSPTTCMLHMELDGVRGLPLDTWVSVTRARLHRALDALLGVRCHVAFGAVQEGRLVARGCPRCNGTQGALIQCFAERSAAVGAPPLQVWAWHCPACDWWAVQERRST